jgi:hypothetical protein
VPRPGFQWQVKRTFSDEKKGRVLAVIKTCLTKRPDTVGQPPSAEICVSHMPASKAKKLRKLLQEKVLIEL